MGIERDSLYDFVKGEADWAGEHPRGNSGTGEGAIAAADVLAWRLPSIDLNSESLDVDLRVQDHPKVVSLRPVRPGAMYIATDEGLLGASRLQLGIKRFLDIVIAVIALVVLAPLMAVIAFAIKVSAPGPVFFAQERVGRKGERFRLLKFRTMSVDDSGPLADRELVNEVDGPVFKMRRAPRVTNLGFYLRKLSFDEIPQLVHVISGRMSIVGPRPPIPSEVDTYNTWELQRLEVKPGLTCIWQVSGRSDLDFNTWMHMDIEYIAEWSLGLDLRLIAKTLPAVISGRGAY
jgi:lipopolysaccharide/colanic/teichoic acid biosynthesis glycosyltransferase